MYHLWLRNVTSVRWVGKIVPSVRVFWDWLNWLKLKLPLETQIKGLLSNINPKIHFFNYSADVNPSLHCSTGIIDANFKWEWIRKKQKVIGTKTVLRWCPNYFPPSLFPDQRVHSFFFFYVTSVNTKRTSVVTLSSVSVLLLTLSPSLLPACIWKQTELVQLKFILIERHFGEKKH